MTTSGTKCTGGDGLDNASNHLDSIHHNRRKHEWERYQPKNAGLLDSSQGRCQGLSGSPSLSRRSLHLQVSAPLIAFSLWRSGTIVRYLDEHQLTTMICLGLGFETNRKMEAKWGLNLPDFPGTDQCVKLSSPSKSTTTTTDSKSSTTASTADVKQTVGEKMDEYFLVSVASQSFS